MPLHQLPYADSFNQFSLLCLNSAGRYVEPGEDLDDFTDGRPVDPSELPGYLQRKIRLPAGVTDVFVWVHGWQNEHPWALAGARRLFAGIARMAQDRRKVYPGLAPFVPGFVAVRWPSLSSPLPAGYRMIRDRAAALTEKGDAAFFLASLLGYLDTKNTRAGGPGSRTLQAKGGFFIHCLGHSFGGRFLTAAISAAGNPQARTRALLGEVAAAGRKVLSATGGANGFQFTVDSMLIFQMAAPRSSFGAQLSRLIDKAPLRGPIVLTFSTRDRANCVWHRIGEKGEQAIGCSGAAEPRSNIVTIPLGGADHVYTDNDFAARIVNVNATSAYSHVGFRVEGAHSDFWYEESVHLILSLVNFVRL